MGNELVTTGGGAIVPADTGGGEVGEHVGDVSLYRDPAPAAGADRGAGVTSGGQLIINDLLPRLNLTDEQQQVTFAWMRQNAGRLEQLREDQALDERLALDKREQAEAVATMRGKWGASYEANVREVHEWLLDALGKDATEEVMRARDFEGTAILNKGDFLEALLEAARSTLSSDDTADRAAAERVMRTEWRLNYDVDVGLIRRYVDGLSQTVQEAIYWARDQHGVLLLNRPAGLRWLLQLATRRPSNAGGGPSPDLSGRVREIEKLMAAPKGSAEYKRYYDNPEVQSEYRELAGVAADTPRVADADVGRRIAEIEKCMGARRGSAEYKRYWDDAAVQREYGELLGRREQHNRRQ